LRAKYRHALAVAGRARRLANEPRQDGRSHSHTGTGV
jgi:DNA-directed RNA polymerase subunit K/omega